MGRIIVVDAMPQEIILFRGNRHGKRFVGNGEVPPGIDSDVQGDGQEHLTVNQDMERRRKKGTVTDIFRLRPCSAR